MCRPTRTLYILNCHHCGAIGLHGMRHKVHNPSIVGCYLMLYLVILFRTNYCMHMYTSYTHYDGFEGYTCLLITSVYVPLLKPGSHDSWGYSGPTIKHAHTCLHKCVNTPGRVLRTCIVIIFFSSRPTYWQATDWHTLTCCMLAGVIDI